jgi:hypothetical protein
MRPFLVSSRICRPLSLAAVWLSLCLPPRAAEARVVTWTLSGSAGFGYEVHPRRNVQAENVMLALGVGFLADCLRLEAGALTAYGNLAGERRRDFKVELRPMLRLKLPVLPLYGRLVFAGLNPFASDRNIAYGGALGLSIRLGRIALFAEAGPLPRRAEGETHWVMEARAGLGLRL